MLKGLNSERNRSIIFQIIAVIVVISLGFYLFENMQENMAKRNLSSGFDFLSNNAGFQILYSPFMEFSPSLGTYFDTFLIGIGNTLLVSVLGIISSTIVGFAVGVSRLSSNWIVNRLALIYIELFRNIPLLLQIMFWYFAILIPSMPGSTDPLYLLSNNFILSNEGLIFPVIIAQATSTAFWIGLLVALIGFIFFRRWANNRQAKTGQILPVWTIMILGFILFALIWYFLLDPYEFTKPAKERFTFVGGPVLIPELAALWFALTTYTSAFIAETVRAGIESVPKGQTEAAKSLGLSNAKALRLVVIPQALRLIIPPQTSQYLNLAKNSSLATAIGYPDLVALFAGTALNQIGKAVEIISMTMLVYLTISLCISMLMNWYNHKISLTER